MGYVCNYIIIDVIVWLKWMQGYQVLYFMGWDVFGLLVENVVIEWGIFFKQWIEKNIVQM